MMHFTGTESYVGLQLAVMLGMQRIYGLVMLTTTMPFANTNTVFHILKINRSQYLLPTLLQ